MSRWFFVVLFLGYMSIGNALECYVCTEQAGNVEKCTKTIKTCEQNENYCITEVRWGSTPYWTSGGQKQFFVSKTCATEDQCKQKKKSNIKYCSHLWYQDWKCYDCCVGDRCNYFIISGGDKETSSIILLLAAAIVPMLGAWFVK